MRRLRSDQWNRLRDATQRLRRTEDVEERDTLKLIVAGHFTALDAVEQYHVFPGKPILDSLRDMFETGSFDDLAETATRVARVRSMGIYRHIDLAAARASGFLELMSRDNVAFSTDGGDERPYFEVLIVDDEADPAYLQRRLRSLSRPSDDFRYETVVVSTFEDAILAALANPSLSACVLRFSFPFTRPGLDPSLMKRVYTLLDTDRQRLAAMKPGQRTAFLGELLVHLRQDLDLYRVTDAPVENVVGESNRAFRRIFYQAEDHRDLHVSLLQGVGERFEAPFFDALRRYAERPTAMFHALPISRGHTITKSNWIQDFGDFYGTRLFLAETSATTGGLDSLLQPVGSLKQAQQAAARAFGSDRTFFVTNGTSTANKIVLQALTRPNDLVLLSHDCHKSHPYACILSGANPIYLDGYALSDLSIYGGIELATIKRRLLLLKRCNQLHRVKILLLTNITFDGVTYDPYQVMKEVLAIHPGIAFVWDEAWFAYGAFSPLTRPRTAMAAAKRLETELRSPAYAERFAAFVMPDADEDWIDMELLPDPKKARVRVYATQSTHKTLTSLRQGSMIHVHDPDFEVLVEDPFHEAYMMHTSTSPNYQILASMDVGRRQAELEGYAMVAESIDLALLLRERIHSDPVLHRYFRVLGPRHMIPEVSRPSGVEHYVDDRGIVAPLEQAWTADEFVLDPTRVTVHVGRTGMDGDTFKNHLMDEHAVHINKTSRNSLLFMVHIGTNRGTIAHLVEVLIRIAEDLDRRLERATADEVAAHEAKVHALTYELPPLPNFSAFHAAFVSSDDEGTGAGDMRLAYYLAHRSGSTRFVPLDATLALAVAEGLLLVASSFVTPYPPGFPVLVPGQILSESIVAFLLALETTEIHGLHPELGLRVFTDEALASRRGPGESSGPA